MISTSWNPWRELDDVRNDFNRLFAGGQRVLHRAVNSQPAINVDHNDDGFVVTARLPGVDADKVELTVDGNTLTIQGELGRSTDDGEATFHRCERMTGMVTRTIHLPANVDSASAEATYTNGVLTITLQRPAEEKPRKIAVSSL